MEEKISIGIVILFLFTLIIYIWEEGEGGLG